ncbi:MAG: FtsX-like permease family protein [Dehalococcoidia bacterium]|nr:FtsX-like permease family protein [Dehalococcoidia bacterium]
MVAINNLNRKLIRDLLAAKAQFGAVVAIIAIGIIAFVGVYESYRNLYLSYEYTYDLLSMGDYWVSVDYLPARATREIDSLPGVTAEGRIIGNVKLDLAQESGKRVEARIVSMPAGVHPAVNDVEVQQGEYLSPGHNREILLEQGFADYHGFEPGDWLTIERDGIKASFRIVGSVVSPEYIWIAKSAQEPIATPETYGIIFMPHGHAEDLFGMQGLVNDISFTLEEGTDEDAALAAVRTIIERNGIKRISTKNERVTVAARKIDIVQGVRTAYIVAREDQPSHQMLKSDLDGFQQMAVLFPMLFLGLAALAIYVLLNRLVESQRIQIGLMRALGYSKLQVLTHYLGFALAVGVLGSAIGAVAGHGLSRVYTAYYVTYLHIPYIEAQAQWGVVIIGVLVGTIVPATAGITPAWATFRLRPAEAMRPPAPPIGHRTFIEVLLPFIPRMSTTFKLPLRNMFRNLRRTLFMATGVMSATAMILVSLSFVDMMDYMFLLFERVPNYDARIIFQGIGSSSTAAYIEHLDEVDAAEATLEQPFRLKFGDQVMDTAVLGMEPGTDMYRLFLEDGSPVKLPDDGILLTTPARNKLRAEPGDIIRLEPLIGTVGTTELQVTGIVDEPMGGKAYVTLEQAQELFKMPGAATGALVRFHGEPDAQTLERIYNLPEVASIETADVLLDYFDESMGFFWAFVGIMLAMSFGLGIAIVFNGVTINVLERRREIAVMRAVGLGDRQLARIITVENLGVAAFGILIGLPAGYQIANAFMTSASESVEGFAFTAIIYPKSYVIAAACSVAIMLISQIPAIRQVTRMSLPTVTKGWVE